MNFFVLIVINLHIIGSSTNGIGDNASTVDICVMAHKKSVLAQPSSEPQVSSVSGDEDKGEDKKDKTDEKEKEKFLSMVSRDPRKIRNIHHLEKKTSR